MGDESVDRDIVCDCLSELPFAGRFAQWRKSKGLPLKSVAADLGVSLQAVSDWERGTRFPSRRYLSSIEQYTRIPLCMFFRAEGYSCPYAHALPDAVPAIPQKAERKKI